MSIVLTNSNVVSVGQKGYFVLTWFALFVLFFVGKLMGFIEVPALVGAVFFLKCAFTGQLKFPSKYNIFLLSISTLFVYAGCISIIWGIQEVYFFLKFGRALLMFVLVYYIWNVISKYWSYDRFCKAFILMTIVHSFVIFFLIVSPNFRNNLYAITGYIPRGPAWSRSPGMTISFNAPAILHITALWLLVSRDNWNVFVKILASLIILSSLVFLGRFIAWSGILFISLYSLVNLLRSMNLKRIVFILFVFMGILLLFQLKNIFYIDHNTDMGQILFNVNHFFELFEQASNKSYANYYNHMSASQYYLSDDWRVLFFGNSMAGHAGILDKFNSTNSDLGIVNSINAIGIPATICMYFIYFLFIWYSRHGDWQTVALVVFLTLSLTFKETGFFTSHATPLLFLIFFYQGENKCDGVHPQRI